MRRAATSAIPPATGKNHSDVFGCPGEPVAALAIARRDLTTFATNRRPWKWTPAI